MNGHRLVQAVTRGVAAAMLGAVVGAALTRALMRAIIVVAGGTPTFTWTGTAFIAIFYAVFLTPGAVALAVSEGGEAARFLLDVLKLRELPPA